MLIVNTIFPPLTEISSTPKDRYLERHTYELEDKHEDNRVKDIIPDSWLGKPHIGSSCLFNKEEKWTGDTWSGQPQTRIWRGIPLVKLFLRPLLRTSTPNLRSSNNFPLAFLESKRIPFLLFLAPKAGGFCTPPFPYVEILLPPKVLCFPLSFLHYLHPNLRSPLTSGVRELMFCD